MKLPRRRTVGAMLIAVILSLSSMSLSAQDAATGIFSGAKVLYEAAQAKPPEQRIEDYRGIRRLLDLIVNEHPSSDLAVSILLQERIDGVDVAAVDAVLEEADAAASPSQEIVSPVTEQSGTPLQSSAGVESSTNETAIVAAAPTPQVFTPLRSEKEIVADLQSELNRIGCGAGTADGVPGQRTRTAFSLFVQMSGSRLLDSDLSTEDAVAAVRAVEEPICTSRWAVNNAPVLLSGNWGYRADCQLLFRKVRITGSMNMRYSGSGQYSGDARNSLGERGPIYASISGNTVRTRIDFPRSKISSSLSTSSRSMSLSGKDSNGCEIVAWKVQ